MASRRPPRVFEDRAVDWGSDIEEQDDDEHSFALATLRSPTTQYQTGRSATHPFLTEFGPDSLQTFLRKGIEDAKRQGLDVLRQRRKETWDTKDWPSKNPRPGFQKLAKLNLAPGRRKNIEGEDSHIIEDETAIDGDDEFKSTEVRQRPQRRRVSENNIAGYEDQDPFTTVYELARSNTVSPSEGGLATGSPLRKQSINKGPILSASGKVTPRRSKHAKQSGVYDGTVGLKQGPVGQPSRPMQEDERKSKENILPSRREGQNLFGPLSNSNQVHRKDAMATTEEEMRPVSAICPLAAFQRDEERRFRRSGNTNDNDALFFPGSSLGDRNSRNVDFELHINTERQSRREDKSSPKMRQRGKDADVDDDSPRLRKPARRRNVFPAPAENAPLSAAPHSTLASSSASLPVNVNGTIVAAVDGMWDDILNGAASFHPRSSTSMSERTSTIRWATQVNSLGFGGRPPTRRFNDMIVLDTSGDSDGSVPVSDVPSDSVSQFLPEPELSANRAAWRNNADTAVPMLGPPSAGPINVQGLLVSDYGQIVPETLPREVLRGGLKAPLKTTSGTKAGSAFSLTGRDGFDSRPNQRRATLTRETQPSQESLHYPREWKATDLPIQTNDPPSCPLSTAQRGWPQQGLCHEILTDICRFLSHEDVRNLRLVSQPFKDVMTPILFRSVVTKFGRSMFDINKIMWNDNVNQPPTTSLFKQLGQHINKFGITFDFDMQGLQSAPRKIIQRQEESWFGDYVWPVKNYPRYPALQSIEDLVDNNRLLLRDVMGHLSKTSELALSIDSGHGWLNGPDMSDMAIYNVRCDGGTRVFGRTFQGGNKWHEYGRNELLKWAQQNTINEAVKAMQGNHQNAQQDKSSQIQFLKSVVVRDYASFKGQAAQPDRDAAAHTGGRTPNVNLYHHHHHHHVQGGIPALANLQQQAQPNQGQPQLQPMQQALQHPDVLHQLRTTMESPKRGLKNPRKVAKTPSQWPIIFNGHNIAAEVGGHCNFIQNKIALPQSFPLRPGDLTEAQAQWLMETVWAQRAFLSAYTTSLIMNKPNLKGVHSLHIAKLSSGLLPSLAQREFWSALPGLETLRILISPDWRTDYIIGDREHKTNMRISPLHASTKFAEFLHQYVSRIEHLSSLTVGFIGGGEHATGIGARNQNILPAPITSDPRAWLSDHKDKPDVNTIMKFDHIRTLAFENCWFSPCMLEAFMAKSCDTSLRHLILDSVSLTGTNSSRTDGPLTTADNSLGTHFGREAWLQERLPSEGCWPSVLDRLTPGVTFFERKVAAGMIATDEIEKPENKRHFRGNVKKITLRSVGYVKISGIAGNEFNQNGLVVSVRNPMDEGVRIRKTLLEGDAEHGDSSRRRHRLANWNNGAHVALVQGNAQAPGLGGHHGLQGAMAQALQQATTHRETAMFVGGKVMMSRHDPQTGSDYFGLGKLTQCVHPVEKRLLEQAWGMEFGWGDNMERWAAVEDGCFEGGTGRFSGVISEQDARQSQNAN